MNRPEVTIIDYGVGNLLSVQRGFESCGAKVTLSSDSELILGAERVVLPGVGAFKNGMRALENLHLDKAVKDFADQGKPLMGICLGMQLLLDESEEFGVSGGLGLIAGRVIPIPNTTNSGTQLKVPNIGWSSLQPSSLSNDWSESLLNDVSAGEAAYFVHSFMAMPSDPAHCLAECIYGGYRITAAITKENITGCQFHPEKSGEVGLKILHRFLLA